MRANEHRGKQEGKGPGKQVIHTLVADSKTTKDWRRLAPRAGSGSQARTSDSPSSRESASAGTTGASCARAAGTGQIWGRPAHACYTQPQVEKGKCLLKTFIILKYNIR